MFLCGMLGVNVFIRGYILVSLIERRVVSCMLVVANISIFGEFRVLAVSYEVSSQPFYHGGAPIMVSQNTLEVCEAEPELAASPLAPHEELAAHDEAVGAIVEDIPAVVEESNSQVDSSVAQKQLVIEGRQISQSRYTCS